MGGVKYLLTLNCKHIANAHELPRIYQILRDEGFDDLLICTPSEFLGGHNDETTRFLTNFTRSASKCWPMRMVPFPY